MNRRGVVIAVIVGAICIAVSIAIGIGIGKSLGDKDKQSASTSFSAQRQTQEAARRNKHKGILDRLSPDNIRDQLKFLSKGPHVGGTPESKKLGEYVSNKWKSYGLDKVETFKYNILLSYPTKPGRVELYDELGKTLYSSEITEKSVMKSEDVPGIIHPFNAYAKGGTAEGELVYANYGRQIDIDKLVQAGFNLTGKVLIMKYGKTSRSLKVERAQTVNAAGCIIYSDPKDFQPSGRGYPHTWYMADDAIERGTIIRHQGDLLTPEYPAKDGFYRKKKDEVLDKLPKIPSQPMSWNQARHLMSELDGAAVFDSSWQGGLNFTYRINATKMRKVKVTVNTIEETRPTYTVCGTLYGDEEPDRIIMLGNHRDSWTFGAGDALSGQAAMMDIARVLGEMKGKGWRPRRTIMMCSWDAEEHSIMGSTEWVEEHAEMIRTRVIAYINVDIAVQGNYTFRLKSMPMLDNTVLNVAKEIPAADDPSKTLYEDWKKKLPSKDKTEPAVTMITSGSDYKPFSYIIGVPACDLRYNYDSKTYPVPMYPTYHTLHDTFDWMQRFNDPQFRYHLTVAKMWTKLALHIADSNIIPFDLKRWSKVFKYYADKLVKDYGSIVSQHNITFDKFQKAAQGLQDAIKSFHERVDGKQMKSAIMERTINDQLTYFERNWIHPTGLLDVTRQFKHVIFWPSPQAIKSGNKFSGFQAEIFRIKYGMSKNWDAVNNQLTLIIYHIEMATKSLQKTGLDF